MCFIHLQRCVPFPALLSFYSEVWVMLFCLFLSQMEGHSLVSNLTLIQCIISMPVPRHPPGNVTKYVKHGKREIQSEFGKFDLQRNRFTCKDSCPPFISKLLYFLIRLGIQLDPYQNEKKTPNALKHIERSKEYLWGRTIFILNFQLKLRQGHCKMSRLHMFP